MSTIWRAILRYSYKATYVIGTVLIIVYTIIRLFEISTIHNNESSPTSLTATLQQTDKQEDTLTSLVIKPIVNSPRNQVIFEGVFWLILWILLFMLIPSGLLPLKKFKMFNLEFEIGEKEAAAIEKISQNSSKAFTMVNYTSEESVVRFFKEFNEEGEVTYQQGLDFFLQDLVRGYKSEFDTVMNFKIYLEKDLPKKYRALSEESKSTKQTIVLNKLEDDNPLHYNWLVYFVPDQRLVTVLTSRLTPFDAMDQYLVTFLHNYVYRIVENRNYAMALTELIEVEDEDDGQTG